MVEEAKVVRGEGGMRRETEGWFVANLRDVPWSESERFGAWTDLEGGVRFGQLGINVHVIRPGQPNCMYHRESDQEDFLVLSGECVLIVEGKERRLRAGDFFHAPPETEHVFVGAGSGPCAILMVGARTPGATVFYPVNPVARKHGAGVAKETPDPRVAYADMPPKRSARPAWLPEPSR